MYSATPYEYQNCALNTFCSCPWFKTPLLHSRDKICSQNPKILLNLRKILRRIFLVCLFPSLFRVGGGGEWNKTAGSSKISDPWSNGFLNSIASIMHGSLWLLGAHCKICEATQTARFSAALKICWMQQIHNGMQPGSVFHPRLREYKAYTRKCFYLSHSATTSSHNTTRETARVCCAPAISLASPLWQ